MRHALLLQTCILLIMAFAPTLLIAGPLEPSDHPHKESVRAVHEANHEVDQAWEVYHQAALGGTVASPALQSAIEQHLHKARTLVPQAQDAAERGDESQVENLIKQIRLHTTQAINGSKEQKK